MSGPGNKEYTARQWQLGSYQNLRVLRYMDNDVPRDSLLKGTSDISYLRTKIWRDSRRVPLHERIYQWCQRILRAYLMLIKVWERLGRRAWVSRDISQRCKATKRIWWSFSSRSTRTCWKKRSINICRQHCSASGDTSGFFDRSTDQHNSHETNRVCQIVFQV